MGYCKSNQIHPFLVNFWSIFGQFLFNYCSNSIQVNGNPTGLKKSTQYFNYFQGIGSFTGGQIIEHKILTLSGVFVYYGIGCTIWSTVVYIIYILFGRKREKKLIDKNEAKRLIMEGQKTEKNEIQELSAVRVADPPPSYIPDFDTGRYSVTHF